MSRRRSANDDVYTEMSARFDSQRIAVGGLRHLRVWGVQVDDERELPGLARTQVADEEIWEINLGGEGRIALRGRVAPAQACAGVMRRSAGRAKREGGRRRSGPTVPRQD